MVEGPIELRVHGVSGTPPEAMLDHPHVRRCAGDDEAGFYRRRYPDGLTPPGADRLEAYSWGGLTSGSSLRVLWLLLLPFTLVNVSHFMQPRELPAGDRRRRLLEAVPRLLALSLTLTLVVLAVAVVTVLLSRTARRPLPVGPVDSGGRPIPPLPVDGGEPHTPPSATLPEGAPTTGDEAAGCPAPGEPAGDPGQPAGDREQNRERLLDRVLAANRMLAVALVPASMLYAGWPWPGAWEAIGALPGFAPAIKALFLVQVVSVAVLLAATLAVRVECG